MINVVVVDDHAVFRECLRALLARVPDISVVGEASTTDEAVAVTSDAQPDVVLMDLNLPGGGVRWPPGRSSPRARRLRSSF